MGDLNYFIKNSSVTTWVILLLIIALFAVMFFKFISSKLKAFFVLVAFVASCIIFISYVSLHPFLNLLLIAAWIIFLMFIAVGSMSAQQRNELLGKSAQKENEHKHLEDLKSIVICPHCGSTDVTFMQNNKKAFSLGKAVGGSFLAGPLGSIAGFAGKKGKNEFFCKTCNRTFEK